ncbi:hypothetical protein [Burkholderia ubonensis]|uniref:hypothetical protein n=1 Tax=Burkholderia ubonensis TaxID=101571 RepID=UPI000B27E4E1|nr:hypothetical protein [Burkholderia ubonensis]
MPASINPPPFKEFVVKTIFDQYEENQSPLLLSRIGQIAIKKKYDLKNELKGRQLASYIQSELADKIEILAPDNMPGRLQARPRGNAAIAASGVDTTPPKTDLIAPRLNKTLWLAFSRPLQEDHVRHIQMTPFVHYWDLPTPSPLAIGRLEIQKEFILDTSSLDPHTSRDNAIQSNITKWFAENQLDLERFHLGQSKKPLEQSRDGGLLSQIIARLNENDLKRIVVPLDIIAKLMR